MQPRWVSHRRRHELVDVAEEELVHARQVYEGRRRRRMTMEDDDEAPTEDKSVLMEGERVLGFRGHCAFRAVCERRCIFFILRREGGGRWTRRK